MLETVSKEAEISEEIDQLTQPESGTQTELSSSRTTRKIPKWIIRTGLVFGVLLLFLGVSAGVLAAISYQPAMTLKTTLPQLEVEARAIYDALKTQNLVEARSGLTQLKATLDTSSQAYKRLAWLSYSPFRPYYQDGSRVLIAADSGLAAASTLLDTVEPYADVLGFSGEGTFMGGTAEDRIVKIIETLDKVTPALDEVAADLQNVQTQLEPIDPTRYPFEIRGRQLDDMIVEAKTLVDTAVVAVTDVKPLLEVLPEVAGIDGERKYLVLFQNDAEIRPTGGFMTAYGVLRVEKGKVFQENSDDIYNLDAKYRATLTPPPYVAKHLKVNRWYLRDMNMDPDFSKSMDQFLTEYLKLPGEPKNLDGIVAVDTQVLTNLVRILGPIEVPGFGRFTADIDPRCDCPQVIYELEDYSTRPVGFVRDDRKAFLAPMMQTLLVKAYGSPKQIWPELFQTVIKDVREKHVLFYMLDERAQAAAEKVNIAGRLLEVDHDYFHMNESNLGGAKSNLFITHQVEEMITLNNGQADKEYEITFTNNFPASNCNLEAGKLCLNAAEYTGYLRFYFPQGTTLVEVIGFQEGDAEVYDEAGKTVIAGTYKLRAQSSAKLKLRVSVPYAGSNGLYRYMIQKQPGQKLPAYTVVFDGVEKREFELATDQTLEFKN